MFAVHSLYRYPVKSFKGESVDQLQFDAIGPQGDRRWMLVDGRGRFITQRQHPRMCLIAAQIKADGLFLSVPDGSSCFAIYPEDKSSSTVKVWSDDVSGLDCGDGAADFCSEFLKVKCRLVYMHDDCIRLVDTDYAKANQRVSFADGFPLLLIGQSSLEELNTRLNSAVDMLRFRPNLVVSGAEPFAEDHWKKIRVGSLSLEVVKPCSRCVMPSINPQTAEKQTEVLAVLKSFRQLEGVIYFGQNVLAPTKGSLSVGDQVEVLD